MGKFTNFFGGSDHRSEQAAAEQVLELSEAIPTGVYACVQVKGGGSKTTTAVNMASLLAHLTHATVVLIDANPASGNSGRKVGRDYHRTVTVQGLLQAIQKNPKVDAKDLLRLMRPTRYGVRVVAADPIIDPQTRFYDTQWDTILDVLTTKFEYIIVDMGNDITDKAALTILNRWTSVLVVTATVGNYESLLQMATTEETMRRFGIDATKVNASVAAFSNGDPGQLSQYLEAAQLHDRLGNVVARHIGPAVVVRHDRYLASPQFDTMGVDFSAISSRTLLDYYELLIILLEQAYLLANGQPYHSQDDDFNDEATPETAQLDQKASTQAPAASAPRVTEPLPPRRPVAPELSHPPDEPRVPLSPNGGGHNLGDQAAPWK
ncbi:MAG TPA: hypothetical protein VGH44_05995 [Candidatus Saccharimonadia bacterium]|jgi:cellulose biosynthesis protein BcsQ